MFSTLYSNEEIMEMYGWEREAKGIVKGEKRGRAEGKAEGKAEGRIETQLENIVSLMEETGWSPEEAMRRLRIPEEERAEYSAALLKKKN